MTQAPPITLADFLLARIAEDEDVAQAAGPTSPTRWQIHTTLATLSHGERVGPRGTVEYAPARVLAECEAKRGIIDSHRPYENVRGCCLEHDGREPITYFDCDVCCEASEYAEQGGYCRTLRLLAEPYADHPDFQPEWRA